MGACCSQPSEKYEVQGQSSKPKPATGSGAKAAAKQPATPDFGLQTTHEVIKLLGRGGEGETWLCRDKETNAEVAIKLIKRPIPKPAIQVIKREIKIQADLGQGHLNIVSADEVILSKTYLGLIMEYVPGVSRPGPGPPVSQGDASWVLRLCPLPLMIYSARAGPAVLHAATHALGSAQLRPALTKPKTAQVATW